MLTFLSKDVDGHDTGRSFPYKYKNTLIIPYSNTKQKDKGYQLYESHRNRVTSKGEHFTHKYTAHKNTQKRKGKTNSHKLNPINWQRMGVAIDRQFGALAGIIGASQVISYLIF